MKYRGFFILMFCAIFIGGISSLISPILIQIWSNDSVSLSQERIIVLLIVLLLTAVIEMVIVFLREKFAENFNISNCINLLEKYLNLYYDTINEKGSMYLLERIAISVNTYYSYFTGDIVKIWSNIVVIIVVIILILIYNPYLAFVLTSLIPINYFGYKMINNKLLIYSKVLQENTSSSWQQILSVLKHSDYIKQSSRQERERLFEQFSPSIKKIYRTMAKTNIFAQTTSQALNSVNTISNVMIMTLLVYRFISGDIHPLALILYTVILPLYFNNMNSLIQANLSKRDMMASNEFIKTLEDNQEKYTGQYIDNIVKVKFDMNELKIGNRILAKNIKSEFFRSDVVWVKGESGTGKSTLLKLLPKFRESSDIFINDINLSKIDIFSIRENIEYLSQNVPIINGTLRDNLFLGKPYSKELEFKMIKDPILQSILKSKNMETQILDEGANLSGGEKQKIAIVRALYNKSSVMILDEIASNIDKDSADEIYKRILEQSNDKIIFIISHDQLPINIYNKTLVL